MPALRSARAPWRLITLIGAVTLAPLVAFSWLGWRWLEQDRLLVREQARQRLELAADLAVSALERAVDVSAQRLAAGSREWPEGAVGAIIAADRIDVFPPERVAYLPVVLPLREPGAAVFADAETIEYRRQDYATAADIYRHLSGAADPAIRAGALVRLGRNLERLGRVPEALTAYERLADIDDAGIDGFPASLLGRYARGVLFEKDGFRAELQAEADRLAADLQASRWRLTPDLYRLSREDARRWRLHAGANGDADAPAEPVDDAFSSPEVFAAAVARLWERRRALPSSGREAGTIDGHHMTMLWHSDDEALHALVAHPAFVASEWLAAVAPVAEEHHIALRLGDTIGDGAAAGGPVTRRAASETGLPWNVAIASTASTDHASVFAERRRWQIGGFALLATLILAASYATLRGISRELAVARMQSDFVAAVSHEFRTPLTALRQFTDMLREQEDRPPDDGRARRVLCYDAQSRATDRLIRLVESLLEFGRMDAGAWRYQFAERDCAELVARVVEEFQVHAGAAGYRIQFVHAGPLPVRADAEALPRAIWNLLDNAMKYSPECRTIEVHVRGSANDVRIDVRDHGIGIPPDERSSIFGRFQRGAQARTRGIAGTGIGLAMVAEIVRAHGGRLEVASELGRGSTFTIVLAPSGAPRRVQDAHSDRRG